MSKVFKQNDNQRRSRGHITVPCPHYKTARERVFGTITAHGYTDITLYKYMIGIPSVVNVL